MAQVPRAIGPLTGSPGSSSRNVSFFLSQSPRYTGIRHEQPVSRFGLDRPSDPCLPQDRQQRFPWVSQSLKNRVPSIAVSLHPCLALPSSIGRDFHFKTRQEPPPGLRSISSTLSPEYLHWEVMFPFRWTEQEVASPPGNGKTNTSPASSVLRNSLLLLSLHATHTHPPLTSP